ncbi:chemotaxis protein CheD [Clostridium sp. D2Q-14]|uniref:chemotaxis protein CheD n=1 Tax=Anaeromonas gelatinilytica TaxID=2683194 RepID=UPI00193AE8F6|nr:chemotaxis protein CheD [Anaeromonas gelatinilytica]MBS4536027.1 chemotaxis protein CheD [Anaeromonas gelatinilytica]
METIKVGMADLNIIENNGVLVTLGLGSCVGVALYDKRKKMAGLAHVMLPSSKEIKNNSNKAKFADSGIEVLVSKMEQLGADKRYIVAKLAGGAQMFKFNSRADVLKIGERNVIAVKSKLKNLGIKVISEDTGGNFGRTIEFSSNDGSLLIKTIGYGIKTI